MTDIKLMKICSAEVGLMPGHEYLFGLQLGFKTTGAGVGDGGKYCDNINKNCKWENPDDRAKALMNTTDKIVSLLHEAKVKHVSELVGMPVEVELDSGRFKSFRVLTEVL